MNPNETPTTNDPDVPCPDSSELEIEAALWILGHL